MTPRQFHSRALGGMKRALNRAIINSATKQRLHNAICNIEIFCAFLRCKNAKRTHVNSTTSPKMSKPCRNQCRYLTKIFFWTCRLVPTFRRTLLPPSSVLKFGINVRVNTTLQAREDQCENLKPPKNAALTRLSRKSTPAFSSHVPTYTRICGEYKNNFPYIEFNTRRGLRYQER